MASWWKAKDMVPFLVGRSGPVWLGEHTVIEEISDTYTGKVRAKLSGVLPEGLALFEIERGNHIMIFHNPCGPRNEPGGRVAAALLVTEIIDRVIPTLVDSCSPDLVGFTLIIKANLSVFGQDSTEAGT